MGNKCDCIHIISELINQIKKEVHFEIWNYLMNCITSELKNFKITNQEWKNTM